jgi:luciferase family oxidoreductase group 1
VAPILSVLDLSVVGQGSSPAVALASSLELARETERLGYHRYWVAEHHNMPGIASSSPPVLIAHLASVTSRMRVGSGGVMLPNHAPLVVAEQFGMLEALHPGRIDLGIGRAPGTDPGTARALRRSTDPLSVDEFPEQLLDLFAFFRGVFPDGHPYAGITAVPARGYEPEVWLLGSSDYSARAAGVLGLPFSFAHHFSAANTDAAVAIYRATFEASDRRTLAEGSGRQLTEPYVSLGVSVVWAPTVELARFLAGSGELSFVRLRQGRPGPLPTPEEAAAYRFTPLEKELLKGRAGSAVVGDPPTVRAALDELVARTGVQELVVTTMLHSHEARLRSYRLLAEVFA